MTLLSGEVQPAEGATSTATLAPTTTVPAATEATATPAPGSVTATATPQPVEAAVPEAPTKSLCRSAVGLPLFAVLAAWLLRRP